MTSSFFYLQANKNEQNRRFIDQVEEWAEAEKVQTYILDRPLGDEKYQYSHQDYLVVLSPRHKITFVDFSSSEDSFESLVEDFVEDLGSISDKYRYKEAIGRPRYWKSELVAKIKNGAGTSFSEIHDETKITDLGKQRIVELLISLLTGSINDIGRVHADVPQNLLEKVKRKILLFDGDQTRFVYQRLEKSPIYIQGLSGTGKTELLMHKLKELYTKSSSSRIVMTCHNRILAHNLAKRIPDFFNFMKVEQQIKWQERLWCMHAWGSQGDPHSGTYRYICHYYGLPFQRYSPASTFEKICADALTSIKAMEEHKYAFDYVLVDESQDFPESFVELCQAVTSQTVFVAGDVFQSIFNETITDSISPDFLLGKCYRTDPKTLMFAHSLGMGLFEPQKLRWLEDDEWAKCGYIVEKAEGGAPYRLKREPLRRFEDIDKENYNCVEIIPTEGQFVEGAAQAVVSAITRISRENPTIVPDDIGVILIDNNSNTYKLADLLEQLIPRATGWPVNKAYESKQKIADSVFVSNRNNVKGLEFPFVICVTEKIGRSYAYRNSAYMTVTRSFLRSYLIVSAAQNQSVLTSLQNGLKGIIDLGCIEVYPPSAEERESISTAIKHSNANESFYDFAQRIFDEIGVLPLFRPKLLEVLKETVGEDFDRENIVRVVEFNYQVMQAKKQ